NEIDEEEKTPALSDEEGFLPEGSPSIHEEEYGSTSQAAVGLSLENACHEMPSHFELSGTATVGGYNPGFTFTELGVSSGQCSSAPTEVYIPVPVEGSMAAAGVPFGQELYEQLFMSGTIDMYPTLAADPFFSPWGNAGNSYLAEQVHSAFQVDGVRGYGSGYQEADAPMDHNVNPPVLPPSDFGSHPVDHSSRSQGFYLGEPDFVQPPNLEAAVRERIPSPDFANSPTSEIGAPPEHNITWPTGDRPDLSSDDEDSGIWNCLTAKVQAMVTSANPPPAEVMRRILAKYTIRTFNMDICRDRWMGFVKDTWDKVYCLHDNATQVPYSQRLQILESDICSLSGDIDESDSRAADVRKRRKMRELRMATRGENIACLELELGKERSSRAQDARDEARDSEEEAVFIRDGDGSRRVRSFKIKEAEQLKRKEPSCLCFSSYIQVLVEVVGQELTFWSIIQLQVLPIEWRKRHITFVVDESVCSSLVC
ncbi:hypothetical protein Taro_056444, partial [Colocasia esculenta]|nr:hypothetical protein [Colocasia esculenta]